MAQPESIEQFFNKAGPLPVSFEDVRRHPRFYFRTVAEAAIYPIGRTKEPAECFLLTRDLSRSGLSLLHNAQLFPGQRLEITLNGQEPRPIVVVWCKRQAPDMYIVGCKFVAAPPVPSTSEATNAQSSQSQ